MAIEPESDEDLPFGVLAANDTTIQAEAVDGEVVLTGSGARAFESSFTPEAVLASLDNLRAVAEAALAQKQAKSVEGG